MKKFILISLVSIVVILAFQFAPVKAISGRSIPLPTPKPVKANAVCPDPAKPCNSKAKTFEDWELSFKMPAKVLPNKSYESEKFYAVLLKTYPDVDDCDGGEFIVAIEAERKSEQKAQPGRKVFASYECPDMGAVGYEFEGRLDAKGENAIPGTFLAVYAGETKEEADSLLAKLKSKYPDAVVKQMTATFELVDQ